MKTKITLILLLVCVGLRAQIKVNSYGNVGIGYNNISSGYKLISDGQQIIGRYSTGQERIEFTSDNKIKFIAGYYGNFYFTPNGEEQWLLPYQNNVGYLGKSGQQFFKIYGYHIYANGVELTSDERLKTNFREIISPLERINKLNGIQFDYITPDQDSLPENRMVELQTMNKDKLGFAAQKLKEVFPELVEYNEKEDVFYMDYIGLIPVLVEAIKVQQSEIEEIKSELYSTKKGSYIKSGEHESYSDKCVLYQNVPNPFNKTTSISYSIPLIQNKALLNIYNLQGHQIKSYEINHTGEGQILITSTTLLPGIYIYNLIVDGVEIDSKRMILTD